MSIDEYKENEINDLEAINAFIASIGSQERELILTENGKTVGAILTAAQYNWFLDQLDAHQDASFIAERENDKDGAQSLDDFKKEMGE